MINAAVPALLAVVCAVAWDYWGWDRTSVAGTLAFGLGTFGFMIGGAVAPLMGLVPTVVAPGIAVERERKTIDALLATPLSSLEIVIGVLGAKLLPSLTALGAMLPVFVFVVYFGGIDPRWALLAAAASGSTLLTLAAVAIFASVGARTGRRAIGVTLLVFGAWAFAPGFLVGVFARGWPAWAQWTRPAVLWVLDSSPFMVVTHFAGLIRRASLPIAVIRMIGLQFGMTVVLIAWASWRLRPASRALYDDDGRVFLRRTQWVRRRQRPPCGDDPILWKEVHTVRVGNDLERRIELVFQTCWVCMLATATAALALPAFRELLERGYCASPEAMSMPEVHPFSRWLLSTFTAVKGGPAPGQARLDFNIVLRQVSALFSFVFVLVAAGAGAETIAAERERDTWLGLIATPLTGAEILRGKLLGALWKNREVATWMLGIWIVGLCSGALHPLGFAAGVIQLAAWGASSAAIGMYASLWSSSREQATTRAVWLPLLLALSGMILFYLPPATGSVLMGAGSAPFLTWASLVSYEDVAAILGTDQFPQLAASGIKTGDRAVMVVIAWLVGTLVPSAAAFVVARKAVREFDAAVGRPLRGRSEKGA